MGKMTYEELEALCERLSKKLTAVRYERVVLKEELDVARYEIERFKNVWGICIEHYRSVTDKRCPYCRAETAEKERDDLRTVLKLEQQWHNYTMAEVERLEREVIRLRLTNG